MTRALETRSAPLEAPTPSLHEWLASEPFAVALSAGFFGFYAHAGMLAALEASGLSPVRVAGASAGALAGGLWAAGLEAKAIGRELAGLRREHFWDPGLGLGLLRGRLFRSRLERSLPVRDFCDCRVPLLVSTFDVAAGRTSVLASGALAPAIHASCAVPLLFHPVRVGGRLLVDGGVRDRAAVAGLAPGERVLHHWLEEDPERAPARRRTLPERPNMVTLRISGLPRLGPFRLARGTAAFAEAYEATRRALDEPVSGEGVRVAVPR